MFPDSPVFLLGLFSSLLLLFIYFVNNNFALSITVSSSWQSVRMHEISKPSSWRLEYRRHPVTSAVIVPSVLSTRGLLDEASVRPHSKFLIPRQLHRNDRVHSPARRLFSALRR